MSIGSCRQGGLYAERLREGRPSGLIAVSLLRGLGGVLKKLKLLSLPLSTRTLSNTQRESRTRRTRMRAKSIINFLITRFLQLSRDPIPEKVSQSGLFIHRLEICKTLINCFNIL